MMMTRITSWLNRTAQHGAMDIALQDTELGTYSYEGGDGHVDFEDDLSSAREAVIMARELTPAYTHPHLDRALSHVATAITSEGSIDDRLHVMRKAADAVREAHWALMARCDAYRVLETELVG
jgi:hypothetical protein